MPSFSKTSKDRLATCHRDLQTVFNTVIEDFDCSILCGHRGEVDQTAAYEDGKSKLQWPFSKHNVYPSMAVDVAPYPIDWKDHGAFYMFAGYVTRVAMELYRAGKIKHQIRCGADWDRDRATRDQNFNDLPHFELV